MSPDGSAQLDIAVEYPVAPAFGEAVEQLAMAKKLRHEKQRK